MKAALSLIVLCLGIPFTTAAQSGHVNMVRHAGADFDAFSKAGDWATQEWVRNHFWRMPVFTPFFDNKTWWYPGGLAYMDSYAIYKYQATFGENVFSNHPDWVLRDGNGNPLFIPWDCSGGACPQYAADFSNSEFRQWWVNKAKATVAHGYKGLWVDDVNMDWRIGDGWGNFVTPIDRNTGAPMTLDNWRRYMAEFMETIRSQVPGEILHNSLWYAGDGARDSNGYIQREIAAADTINIEHGVNDGGLTGGTGIWSLSSVLGFVDRTNAKGKHVIIDGLAGGQSWDTNGRDYALACYFLVSNGNDGLGDWNIYSPNNWYRGFDLNLGNDRGPRYAWSADGLYRRDFENGFVLVNEPGSPTRTVQLPGWFKAIDGQSFNSYTLGPSRGVVFLQPWM